MGSFSEFMDEYEKTKSKDYKDYIDDVKEQFADFVDSMLKSQEVCLKLILIFGRTLDLLLKLMMKKNKI